MYNPCIRGWITYYSHFYRTQLRPTLKRIDAYVIRWARRKFKRMRHQTKGARDWLDRLHSANPILFAHWTLGCYMATAEHREPVLECRGSCTVLGAPGGEIPPATRHSRPMYSVPVPINVRCYSDSDIIVQLQQRTKRAMCGRLRVGKGFLYVCSIGRCGHVFGLYQRGSLTAGHNALRGSDPGQKLAFDNAVAHVGCPNRQIDRLCITCCSPSQPSHHAGCPV